MFRWSWMSERVWMVVLAIRPAKTVAGNPTADAFDANANDWPDRGAGMLGVRREGVPDHLSLGEAVQGVMQTCYTSLHVVTPRALLTNRRQGIASWHRRSPAGAILPDGEWLFLMFEIRQRSAASPGPWTFPV
jgi:hypothetical protein